MKSQLTLSVLVLGLAACSMAQETPTTSPKKDIDVSGYLDLYYQYDFNKPGSGPVLNGRSYDNRNNQYRLALAQIDISRAPSAKQPYGFFVSILAGPTTDTMHSGEPGGVDNYKNFGQAYVTYMTQGARPLTIDIGKFFTFVGNESNDSRANDNYSRSFLFSLLQPDYHTGVRATKALSEKLSVAAYLFQGWNEVEDGNKDKSLGLGASYTVNPKLSGTLNLYQGTEGSDRLNPSGTYGGIGFPTRGTASLAQADLILNYQSDASTKLALNADYASARGKGNWSGLALYAHKDLSAKSAVAFRAEHVEDSSGLRTGTPVQLHSLTGTYDYKISANVLFRFELREDFANQAFFNGSSGLQKNRTTFTFGQTIKF